MKYIKYLNVQKRDFKKQEIEATYKLTSKRSNWQRKSASWSNKKTCGKRNCGTASVYLSLDCVLIHCPTTSAELCCRTPHYLFFRLNPRPVFCLNMSSSYLLQNFPIIFFSHSPHIPAHDVRVCEEPFVCRAYSRPAKSKMWFTYKPARIVSYSSPGFTTIGPHYRLERDDPLPCLASPSPNRRKPPIRSLYHIIPISFYLPNVGQAN